MEEKLQKMLMEIFEKAGYKTTSDIAKAMIRQGPYAGKKLENVRSYLSQVFSSNGLRKGSPKLVKVLAELCGDEMVLEILGHEASSKTKIKYGLELRLSELCGSLKSIFQNSDLKNKMKICIEFEDYIDGYKPK